MVTVGDVEHWHRGESLDQRRFLAQVHVPHLVPHAIARHEVEQRRLRDRSPHHRVDPIRRLVGEEDGTGLRPDGQQMPGAIVLLVGPRLLVLANQIVIVLVYRETGRHAALRVGAHREPVDIETRRILDHEGRGLPESREVVGRLRISDFGVWVRVRWQIDLGPRHVQEADRIAVGESPSFVARHDIVRHRRHAWRRLGNGSQRTEREYGGHGGSV
jgi:hypothetical protein